MYALSSQNELLNIEHDILHHHHHHHHHHHSSGEISLILPFTIGGFLYVALVGIIPEIVQEEDFKISFKQLIFFLIGILFIYALSEIEHVFSIFV